jgi:putative transposase
MVSAPQRRDGAKYLFKKNIPLRRGCALCGLPRSSFYYRVHPRQYPELSEEITQVSKQYPRYGYRRVFVMLRRRGVSVSLYLVRRLRKDSDLALPLKRPHRRRLGLGIPAQRAESPDHVWTYDFIFGSFDSGQSLKILSVLDEFTRECLALVPCTSMRAKDVQNILQALFRERGAPACLRSDNGPEFIQQALKEWLDWQSIGTIYIDPGSPWQNPYVESFHGKFRDECLSQERFINLWDTRIVVERWRQHYNQERPHSSLNYLTPKEFSERWKLGTLPPDPQDFSLLGYLNGGTSNSLKAKAGLAAPPLSPAPDAALGSVPTGALSSGQAGE